MKISFRPEGANGRITERLPMPPLPTDEELAAMKDWSERERAFWTAHAEELTKLYPEKYVAVHKGEIVAVDDDLVGVLRLVQAQGLRPREIWLQFLTTQRVAIDL